MKKHYSVKEIKSDDLPSCLAKINKSLRQNECLIQVFPGIFNGKKYCYRAIIETRNGKQP